MDVADLVARANAQQPISITRVVSVPGPELKAQMRSGKAMLLSEVYAHPDQSSEIRRFTYRHLLQPGASASEVALWQDAHPRHRLPDDLIALVQRVNGIHLWADVSAQRSYFGILPMAEWRDAAEIEWAMLFQTKPIGLLVLSYHDNGDDYLVLDTNRGTYYWYDLEDFDNPKVIGRDVGTLLGWWWNESNSLDPRRVGS